MPFPRGRGGRGGNRGLRGGFGGRGRGGSRGRGRGGPVGGGDRLARSGIRTRNGYKKFDSQRTREFDEAQDQSIEDQGRSDSEEDADDASLLDEDESDEEISAKSNPYTVLLQSFQQSTEFDSRPAKRRRLADTQETMSALSDASSVDSDDEADDEVVDEIMEEGLADDDDDAASDEDDDEGEDVDDDSVDAEDENDLDASDPFEKQFGRDDSEQLKTLIQDIDSSRLSTNRHSIDNGVSVVSSSPESLPNASHSKHVSSLADLRLKERLLSSAQKHIRLSTADNRSVAKHLFSYQDVLCGIRNPQNASDLRELASLHALNHVLKGRDRVLKNNERLNRSDDSADLDLRDQGFVRPKVLLLLETRQMAAKYLDSIVALFDPEQQENKSRFQDAFSAPIDDEKNMPDDYRELFAGNNDNNFLTAIKFTRKTLKYYSAFYSSDIIVASPLGLRRVIENEDKKKQDYDFLSSIELVIMDQTDAMQMQSWENVEVVFKHLNLQLRETHGCDFNRVRNWYLDGNAKYLRQTVVLSAYITPEMNRLYNTSMLNVAGKAKITTTTAGAITNTSGLGIKQTFSRFDCPSPTLDPDARFKYFTTAILPNLLRHSSSVSEAPGILIFIPSYFDFLRLRNYFATSTATENISFGAIHDYAEISDQRRARSHFLSGRHQFLLYTQRAHHFFRLRLRGVKKLVMYGLPDSPTFFTELVEGMLGGSVAEAKITASEASVRCAFSRWDGLKLERIVGTSRVKAMLNGAGDTFDFV